MKSFYDKEDYNIEDLQSLINNQVEESIYLDFKSAGSLEKSDKKRIELSKDVASFANSDGGIIIYGIKEVDHVASEYSFIDGNEFTKEWIEQVISSYVQRRISNVKIYPIRIDGDIKKSIYIVKISYSYDAPHLSKDNRYYKRYNFMSVPMEEYEIRQTYDRVSKSELANDTFFTSIELEDESVKISFDFMVINIGKSIETIYKLNLYLSGASNDNIRFESQSRDTHINYTRLNRKFKISMAGIVPIFPLESISIGRFSLNIPREEVYSALRDIRFSSVLFYSGNDYKEDLDTSHLWKQVKSKFDEGGYDWLSYSKE